MAKLTRERRLHERRLDKKAKKDARKYAAAHPEEAPADGLTGDVGESGDPGDVQPDLEPVVQTRPEA